MDRISRLMKDRRGSIVLLTAILLAVFVGALALVIDLSHLFVVKNELQNAADSAALAGAQALSKNNSPCDPDWDAAKPAAISAIQKNYSDLQLLSSCQVSPGPSYWNLAGGPGQSLQSTSNGPLYVPAVMVTVQKTAGSNAGPVPMTLANIFGKNAVSESAQAVAVIDNGSPFFNYALFSNLPLTLSGSDSISGSVHSNAGLTLSGTDTITGAAEGYTGVTISGSNTIGSVVAGTLNEITISGNNTIGSESGGAQDIPMPDYTQQIESTPGLTVYNGSEVLSGTTNLTGNIWVKGDLTLSGTINGSGCILVNGSITISGSTTISGSNQIALYSANGNITISGTLNTGTNGSAIIYAPNGSVTISGSQTVNGSIVANQITMSGTLNIVPYLVTTLPINYTAMLVQ